MSEKIKQLKLEITSLKNLIDTEEEVKYYKEELLIKYEEYVKELENE